MAYVAGGHRCEPIGKHTAVGAKDLPYPLLPKVLAETLKERERAMERELSGERTEWGRDLSAVYL
jgi:hypothetical protein